MSEAYDRISKSLNQAISFSEGKKIQAKIYRPFDVDVKAIRAKVGMTQPQFAAAFGIGLGTLRHWERGDRRPRGAALVLLNMLSKDPKAVLQILHQ